MAAARSTPPAASQEPDPADAQTAADKGVEAATKPTVFEYTWGDATQYPHIPLTAYPARPAVAAVPARPATVFAFPDGAPADGRWRPTDLPVNQARDNEPPFVKGA